jgi:hypothetical protein
MKKTLRGLVGIGCGFGGDYRMACLKIFMYFVGVF